MTEAIRKGIRLGDGHKIFTLGVCKDLKIQLAKHEFTVDAFVLELGGLDLIF